MTDTAFAAEIRDKPFAEALGERYLAYALSTIMSRSLPDVRDGLKPVHRRLLYAMRQLKLDPGSGFKKSARVVGDVIGKYHPHGDQAVYDALVRLAQDFAVRYPLIDGQGNFGNIDGDNAAAMRYTEARLTEVARLLLDGIDRNAVDFRPTYDGEEEEPLVLPGAFPNLLANGANGIAVGMATSIPPHNAADNCDALLHLIEHPNASMETLVAKLRGPDFPTGGVLVEDQSAILEAYRTGRGGFRVRARWEVEKLKGGLYQVIVTEIPYQVQKARLIERIAELLSARKLVMLDDVRDESTEEVRIVLTPKSRNVDPDVLMESLFRQTDLESRFSLNMNVLDAENTPRVMALNEVLQAFLDHRRVVLGRMTEHRLGQIERRLEILAGYLVAFLNLDEVIRIVREEDHPKAELMGRFSLTDTQADAILNMRLSALNKLEEVEIQRENEELSAEQTDLQGLLADPQRQWKSIATDLRGVKKMFGHNTDIGRRRTEIAGAPTAVIVPLEAVIERESVTVICSEQGWIRTVRGHVADASEIKYKDGDAARFVMHAETTDRLVLFASNGRFYTIGVDKLPKGRGFGEPLRLSIDLPAEDDVIDVLIRHPVVPSADGDSAEAVRRLLVASSEGHGFIVDEAEVLAQTRTGKQVLNVGEGARAIACRVVSGDHVAVVGENRKMIVFPASEVPEMTRGRGVILQKYKKAPLLKEGLSDICVFNIADGLSWQAGSRTRTEQNIGDWVARRGGQGKAVPNGFPKTNKFR
ncbi:MAG: DNA topoisomerase IV subunit A [Pseudomonadota bacterium]